MQGLFQVSAYISLHNVKAAIFYYFLCSFLRTTMDTSRVWCAWCGNCSLYKVSVVIGADGKMQCRVLGKKQFSHKGLRVSILSQSTTILYRSHRHSIIQRYLLHLMFTFRLLPPSLPPISSSTLCQLPRVVDTLTIQSWLQTSRSHTENADSGRTRWTLSPRTMSLSPLLLPFTM